MKALFARGRGSGRELDTRGVESGRGVAGSSSTLPMDDSRCVPARRAHLEVTHTKV